MLYELLDVIVAGHLPIADAFEERVEKLEAVHLREGVRTREVLFEIYAMKRELANFRGYLGFFPPEYLPYFRDVSDHGEIVALAALLGYFRWKRWC